MTPNQKVGLYETIEKLTRQGIYKLVQEKEKLLEEAEQIDFFELDEEEAKEIWQEKEDLRKEINTLRGYIQLVEMLAHAYLEAIQEAQTFDLVKNIELETAYSEWSKIEKALNSNQLLNKIKKELNSYEPQKTPRQS